MNNRLKAAAALCIAAPLAAFADIKVNDNFTISGYAAGSYEYFSPDPGKDTDSLFNGSKDTPSADAIKTVFTYNLKPVTANISLFYIPNIPATVQKNELTVLDATLSYDAGGGFTVSGGKFLSWLGYEAFDPVNMAQITYSPVTVGTLSAIPAYHTGVRVEYGDKEVSWGAAILDSVYSPNGIDKGDGELKSNAGFEAYVKYTAVADLTLWAGLAYDTKGGFQTHNVTTIDLWAEYAVTKELTLAAEYCNKDGGDFSKGYTWLVYGKYAFTPQVSAVFRVGGETLEGKTVGSDFTQYTFGPAYKVSDNLTLRAEYSYYDYDNGGSKSLFGLQAVFKF